VANAYTATPGIVPGPLTVQGALTVASDQGIKIGGSAPFVRLFKSAQPSGDLSYNLGTDQVTRDNAALFGWDHVFDAGSGQYLLKELNAAGTLITQAYDRTIAQDGTLVSQTGDTLQHTLKSKVIPANTLGAHGALIIEALLVATTQGATSSTFALIFGGTLFGPTAVAVATTMMFRARLQNVNATNSQNGEVFAALGTGTSLVNRSSGAIDTTADQTLGITFQGGAATDNWSLNWWRVHAVVGRTALL
jgi:hypothetical protein